MRKSKLFLSTLLFGGLLLASCSGNKETSTATTAAPTTTTTVVTTSERPFQYTLKVIDIDGKILFNETIVSTDSSSLYSDLERETDLVAYDTQYGHSVSSINGSIVDSNYYLALYENGEYLRNWLTV